MTLRLTPRRPATAGDTSREQPRTEDSGGLLCAAYAPEGVTGMGVSEVDQWFPNRMSNIFGKKFAKYALGSLPSALVMVSCFVSSVPIFGQNYCTHLPWSLDLGI